MPSIASLMRRHLLLEDPLIEAREPRLALRRAPALLVDAPARAAVAAPLVERADPRRVRRHAHLHAPEAEVGCHLLGLVEERAAHALLASIRAHAERPRDRHA